LFIIQNKRSEVEFDHEQWNQPSLKSTNWLRDLGVMIN
jgi:hypothetical protein